MAALEPDNLLSQVLQQLNAISTRLLAIETKHDNVTTSTLLTTTLPLLPNRAGVNATSQHGIRAEGLWRNKDFVLNREPAKYSFKFENAKDYTVWSFTTLKVMEKEGLSSFILGTVPQPPSPTNESSDEEKFLYSRWYEFDSAAMAAILGCVGKSELLC